MSYKHIIENDRVLLSETLRTVAQDFSEVSIASAYWDLPGTREILSSVESYKKIRLLLGQEPISPRNAALLNIQIPQPDFPDQDFSFDLQQLSSDEDRDTVIRLKQLIAKGTLEVRVYRKQFLHAKAYIFGSKSSEKAVGIIGSSNFTRAGLTTNTELNSLEAEARIVQFNPIAEGQEHGHLSWFETLWTDELTESWNGRFTQILENSPVGDLTFSPYEMYIKTLMEIYPEELLPPEELPEDVNDVLFTFQRRNAQLLINKLDRMGVAMLADSVGLGKTITAGAVLKHYKDRGATRIYVIAPANLKSQWIQDLADRFQLLQGFQVISLQDANAIEEARRLDKYKSVDLFIVDEAHNLRNSNSSRYQQLEAWFLDNPDSKVLLLTATPINNGLGDFVAQVQLALKGSLESIQVDYADVNGNLRPEDFFDVLIDIQNRAKRDERAGREFDWKSVAPTIAAGLRHYLVRTTRQGVSKMGGIVFQDGTRMNFPESVVDQIPYSFSSKALKLTNASIDENLSVFEGIDPRGIDLDELLDLTERSEHPLDTANTLNVSRRHVYQDNFFANIYQIILLLGFTPYRPEIYQHRIHKKQLSEINSLGLKGDESFKIKSHLTIHNMLRVSWLKRLESSQAALSKSVEYFLQKIESFAAFLDQGKIMSFSDINSVIAQYGDDVALSSLNLDLYVDADPNIYDLDALRADLKRDRLIASALVNILKKTKGFDSKLDAFAKFLQETSTSKDPANRKILVFSYFTDTIRYLQDSLPALVSVPDFQERAAFVSGGQAGIEKVAGRFSPRAKKYDLAEGESELDYLFSTDVLSEGQNLQDAGTLVNYDLHWNPVRMIQRNGRINRLGSEFEKVYISNMKPEDSLEAYLKLLKRLNRKISTIKNTIGLDQDVTEQGQIDPKEFVENLEKLYGNEAADALKELENQEENFFAEDDYIYDLRAFISENPMHSKQFERIRNIPLGKWGYVPEQSRTTIGKKVMGLAKTLGREINTRVRVEDYHFVMVDLTKTNYMTESLDQSAALQIIRTTPKMNERSKDRIQCDRSLVIERTKSAARAQARKGIQNYKAKPSELQILADFEELIPGSGLLKLISTKMTNKQEMRRFKRLIFQARKEKSEHGQISSSTILTMREFGASLSTKKNDSIEVDEVRTVLFYAY